jgi:hypothetical protein
MHTPDFPIPQEVENLLTIRSVTEEALWLNNEGQLLPCEVNHEIVAPKFFSGNAAKLVAFSQQKYVTSGKISIKLYQTKESAWKSACLDAISELGFLNTNILTTSNVTQIINKAITLVDDLNWWLI